MVSYRVRASLFAQELVSNCSKFLKFSEYPRLIGALAWLAGIKYKYQQPFHQCSSSVMSISSSQRCCCARCPNGETEMDDFAGLAQMAIWRKTGPTSNAGAMSPPRRARRSKIYDMVAEAAGPRTWTLFGCSPFSPIWCRRNRLDGHRTWRPTLRRQAQQPPEAVTLNNFRNQRKCSRLAQSTPDVAEIVPISLQPNFTSLDIVAVAIGAVSPLCDILIDHVAGSIVGTAVDIFFQPVATGPTCWSNLCLSPIFFPVHRCLSASQVIIIGRSVNFLPANRGAHHRFRLWHRCQVVTSCAGYPQVFPKQLPYHHRNHCNTFPLHQPVHLG